MCSNTGVCDEQSTITVYEVEYDCCVGFTVYTSDDSDDRERTDDGRDDKTHTDDGRDDTTRTEDDSDDREHTNDNRDDQEHERSDTYPKTNKWSNTSNHEDEETNKPKFSPASRSRTKQPKPSAATKLLLEGCPTSEECFTFFQYT